MILTHKQIREGELLPRGYGIARHSFTSDTAICYVWPFNLILAWIIKYWQKVRYYSVSNPLEIQAMAAISKREDEIREQGYRRGCYDGERLSLDKMSDELNRARERGARDLFNQFRAAADLDPMPDDWNPYKKG